MRALPAICSVAPLSSTRSRMPPSCIAPGRAGWRYVTHAGEVLEADGTLRAGPLTAAHGIALPPIGSWEALVQQIADMDSRNRGPSPRQLTDGNAAAKALEEQQNALRNEVYRAKTR